MKIYSDHLPSRGAQLDALTSLRFFAAFYVLLFHYSGEFFGVNARPDVIALGYSGVTFFFVLSGFILAYNYARADFSSTKEIRRYLLARVARIGPVYILSLLISLPLFIELLNAIHSFPQLFQQLVLSSAILAPLALHAWVPGAACALNCPSWSISAEFFFYLVFPFLLPWVLQKPRRWLLFTFTIWLVMTGMYVSLWSLYGQGFSLIDARLYSDHTANLTSQLIKFFPLGRLPEFMLGMVLFALWQGHFRQRLTRLAWGTFFVAVVFALLFSHRIPEVMMHNGATALFWAPLILAAASLRSSLLSRPFMVFLGRISFALYLLHLPIAGFVRAADKAWWGGALAGMPWTMMMMACLLSCIAATVVLMLVENPMRRYIMQRSDKKTTKPLSS